MVSTSSWKPHGFTSRNLAEYEHLVPEFLDFWGLLERTSHGNVLDFGTGAGLALLDLKARHPLARAFGTNLKTYGYPQSDGSDEAMWAVSEHFNVSVHCDAAAAPMFPVILNLGKIQQEPLPFAAGFFDLVLSRHSLNEGKLLAAESHCALPRLLHVLKPGGAAALHLLFDTGTAALLLPDLRDNITVDRPSRAPAAVPKTDTILSVTNLAAPGAARPHTSIVLYQTAGACGADSLPRTRFCVGVAARRCAAGDPLHPAFGDCVLPPDATLRIAPVARNGQPGHPPHRSMQSRTAYHREYLKNLQAWLGRWAAEGRASLDNRTCGQGL